jgi:hypothetical protein
MRTQRGIVTDKYVNNTTSTRGSRICNVDDSNHAAMKTPSGLMLASHQQQSYHVVRFPCLTICRPMAFIYYF